MPTPRTVLHLQELDDRALPAVVGPQPVLALGGMVTVAHPTHAIYGSGEANYLKPRITIDAGTSLTLSGSTSLGSLGTFQMTGWLQGVGMLATGRATGELILSNSQGTITLELHGRTQPGFSPLPSEMVYSVSQTTGAYSHLSGYGVVDMQRTPTPIIFNQPQTGTINFYFS